MSPTTYRFRHESHLPAPRGQVHDVLLDLEHYPDWWPQVRAVAKVDDDHAIVVCRSRLPYDLELELSARDRSQERLEVGIDGPIRGQVVWWLHDEGPGGTRLEFEQEVRAEARLVVLGSWLARPLLAWNHRQMMLGADQGLRERLAA